MDSDDDDIFCYTPLVRTRGATQIPNQNDSTCSYLSASQHITTKKRVKKTTCKRTVSCEIKPLVMATKKKKCGDKQECVSLQTEVCPICQMPWISLGAFGKRTVHTNKCSMVNYSEKEECSKKLSCQDTSERHYLSLSHNHWAQARARMWEHNMENNMDSGGGLIQDNTGRDKRCLAGYSGWNIVQKKELCKPDESEDINSSFPTSSRSNKKGSVKIFDLSDNDSLPDLNAKQNVMHNVDEVPDLDFNFDAKEEFKEKYEDLDATIYYHEKDDLESSRFSPVLNQKLISESLCQANEDPSALPENKEMASPTNDGIFHVNDNSPSVVLKENVSTSPTDNCTAMFPSSSKMSMRNKTTGTNISSVFEKSNFMDAKTLSKKQCKNKGAKCNSYGDDTDFYSDSINGILPEVSSESSEEQVPIENEIEKGGILSSTPKRRGSAQGADSTADSEHFNTRQSVSVLRNSEETMLGVTATQERSTSSVSCHQEIEDDDELEPDEYELLNKLVDEAVDKYVGKAQINSKCFHLHIHHHEGNDEKKTSPHKKGGTNSILNYFKPVNAKPQSEAGNSSVSASTHMSYCQKAGEPSGTVQKNKSKGGDWKDLMSRMQSNSRIQSNNKRDSSSKQEQVTTVQGRKSSESQGSSYGGRNRCPFYKYIPDTSIVVDAFSYGYLNNINGYFLSHFHYDHYRGLTKKFDRIIYCSHITAKLVNVRLGIPLQNLRALPMDDPQVICNVEVTLLEANHCPGAVMFLFKMTTGMTVLHVGDFRACPKMESYPALWNCSVDTLFLDTTYCNPVYDFPNQAEILDKCVGIANEHMAKNPKTLFVIGSYTIGKERVFCSIAASLGCRIWASYDKQRTLHCIEDPEIESRLTTDKLAARVHVVPMKEISMQKLNAYLLNLKPRYDEIVAIRPTGWEHSGKDDIADDFVPKKSGSIYIYGIPYSEHSSYNELRRFVKFIQPKKIIPTVNVGNPDSRKKMEAEFSSWLR